MTISNTFPFNFAAKTDYAINKKTSFKLDTFSTASTSTNQLDSSTGAFLPYTVNFGSSSLISGGAADGKDCVRVSLDASSKARITLGASGTGVINAPEALVCNQGAMLINYRLNLAGADTLDSADGTNNVALQTFAWEGAYAGTSHEFDQYLINSTAKQDLGESDKWVGLVVDPATFGSGGIDGDPIGAFSFGAVGHNGATGTTVDIGEVRCNIRQRPSLTIGFDNNDGSHYTYAYNYMRKLGLRGQLYCIPKEWDKSTNLKTYQIDEMAAAGWGIGSHSNSTAPLYSANGWYGVSAQWIIDDLGRDIELLRKYGDGWKHLAWPLGAFDKTALATVKGLGILSARGVGSTSRGLPLCKANAFSIQGFGAFANNVTPVATWAQIKDVIDRTILIGAHTEIWCHSLTNQLPLFYKTMDYIAGLVDSGVVDNLTAPERYDTHIATSLF